ALCADAEAAVADGGADQYFAAGLFGTADAGQGICPPGVGRGLGSIDTQFMDAGAAQKRKERTRAPGGVAGSRKPPPTEKTEAVSSKFTPEGFSQGSNVNNSLTALPPCPVRNKEFKNSYFGDRLYLITAYSGQKSAVEFLKSGGM